MSTIALSTAFTVILLSFASTGCALNQDAQHKSHYPGAVTSNAPGSLAGGPGGGRMSMTDMKAMCDKHNQMMSDKTLDEKKKMEAHMRSMPPEMMQKHMTMMEQCK
ncbi:MAG: hypothetical protein Q7U14_03560 [Lacisediminimonas sp.]|nr:hypothetical protein [Lacisediminimonas sp.]